MPAAASRSVNAIEVYCEPASVWCTSPAMPAVPSRRRVHSACSRASRTRLVRIVAATRQPRIRREYASITNAT